MKIKIILSFLFIFSFFTFACNLNVGTVGTANKMKLSIVKETVRKTLSGESKYAFLIKGSEKGTFQCSLIVVKNMKIAFSKVKEIAFFRSFSGELIISKQKIENKERINFKMKFDNEPDSIVSYGVVDDKPIEIELSHFLKSKILLLQNREEESVSTGENLIVFSEILTSEKKNTQNTQKNDSITNCEKIIYKNFVKKIAVFLCIKVINTQND